ncbi:hypothetical protein RFI_09285, partial [Reticulomyxa filosa]
EDAKREWMDEINDVWKNQMALLHKKESFRRSSLSQVPQLEQRQQRSDSKGGSINENDHDYSQRNIDINTNININANANADVNTNNNNNNNNNKNNNGNEDMNVNVNENENEDESGDESDDTDMDDNSGNGHYSDSEINRKISFTPRSASRSVLDIKADILLSSSKLQTMEEENFNKLTHQQPLFIPDDYSNQCLQCSVEFTFISRRHHCYRCGLLVCKNCRAFTLDFIYLFFLPLYPNSFL